MRVSLILLTLISSFLFAVAVSAKATVAASARQTLQTVRLDDRGYSMENVPVTNQKGIPLCYAFSAAQMVDAYRFTYDKSAHFNHLTSPLMAAVGASWDTGFNYFETLNYGGFLCEAVDSIVKYGSCSQKLTESLFNSIHGFKPWMLLNRLSVSF